MDLNSLGFSFAITGLDPKVARLKVTHTTQKYGQDDIDIDIALVDCTAHFETL